MDDLQFLFNSYTVVSRSRLLRDVADAQRKEYEYQVAFKNVKSVARGMSYIGQAMLSRENKVTLSLRATT